MTSVDPEFKEAVRSYIEMHDQLAEASKQLRDIRKKKKELGGVIVEYMRKNEIDGIKVPGGNLVRMQSNRVQPVNKEHIMEILKKIMDEARAEHVLVDIYGKRAVTRSDSLRRTRTRGAATE